MPSSTSLISKTFDASVICPAEQTCIVDERGLRRDGRRVRADGGAPSLTDEQVGRAGRVRLRLRATGSISPRSGSRRPELAAASRVHRRPGHQDPARPAAGRSRRARRAPAGPGEADARPRTGARRRTSQHGIDVAVLVTEHGGLGHTSAIYATRRGRRRPPTPKAVRTGRILVNAPTAVGALGGVYNNLTPTFSLGCGTWGGSNTTENVNYRQPAQHQDGLAPADPAAVVPGRGRHVYFNAGALANLRDRRPRARSSSSPTPTASRAGWSTRSAATSRTAHVQVFSRGHPGAGRGRHTARRRPARSRPARTCVVAVGGGSVLDAAKVMRLFYEHPDADLDDLRCRSSTPASGSPTSRATRTPSGWSRSPRRPGPDRRCRRRPWSRSDERKVTLVDYTLVPDMAIVDPMLTVDCRRRSPRTPASTRSPTRSRRRCPIFASPYTDAFCVQAVRLILDALPAAVADGHDLEARTNMLERRDAGRARVLQRLRRHSTTRSPTRWAPASASRTGGPTGSSCRTCCATTPSLPSKFMPAPGYTSYVAPDKYGLLGRVVLGGHLDRREPDPPLRRRRRAAGHPRHAPVAEGRRRRRGRVHGAAAAAGAWPPSRT